MNPQEILKEVNRYGATLAVIDRRLVGKGLDDIPGIIRQQLKDNRAEIISLLSDEPNTVPSRGSRGNPNCSCLGPPHETNKTPYLHKNEELVIPANCPHQYKYWAGGQPLLDTLIELGASPEVVEKYIGRITTPHSWSRWQELKKKYNTDKEDEKIRKSDCSNIMEETQCMFINQY